MPGQFIGRGQIALVIILFCFFGRQVRRLSSRPEELRTEKKLGDTFSSRYKVWKIPSGKYRRLSSRQVTKVLKTEQKLGDTLSSRLKAQKIPSGRYRRLFSRQVLRIDA